MNTLTKLLSIQSQLVALYDSDDIKLAKVKIDGYTHDARSDLASAMDHISDAIESYTKANPVPTTADLEAMAGDLEAEYEKE